MAAGDVKQRFLADTSSAEAAYTRLERKLDAQEQKLKQVSRQSRRGANDGDADFKKLATGAAAFASGIGLAVTAGGILQQTIGRLKGEWDDLLQRQQRAALMQQSYQQVFEGALINFGTGEGATPQALQGMIDRIVQRTQAEPIAVARALATALSARGNLSNQDVEAALATTFDLSRNVPELQAPLSGAILDLQKRFSADAEAAAGFILGTGTQARVTNPAQVAANLIPAVGSIAGAGGDSPREAAALLSALTQATSDATGAPSGTAAISLDRQLEEALPDLPNLSERLKFLQDNEDARKKFLKGASFEMKYRTPIEDLLSGGGVAQAYADAFEALPELQDAGGAVGRILDNFRGSPLRRGSDIGAVFGAAAQEMQNQDVRGGEAAVMRQGIEQLMTAANFGPTARQLVNAQFEIASRGGLSEDTLPVTMDLLRGEAADLRRTRFISGGVGAPGVAAPPSEANLELADKLDKVIDALGKVQTATEEQTGVIKEQQPAQRTSPPINRNANTEN